MNYELVKNILKQAFPDKQLVFLVYYCYDNNLYLEGVLVKSSIRQLSFIKTVILRAYVKGQGLASLHYQRKFLTVYL